MKTNKLRINIYAGLSILLLFMLVLTGCGISETIFVEPHSTEIGAFDTPVKKTNAGEIGTSDIEIDPISSPETLTYTDEIFGFEFNYPGNWTLTEYDHGVVLIKGCNRIGIRFQGMDEDADRFSARKDIPAGELIYSDKIRFMDRVILAEVLVSEQKPKIVFYGETGRIVIDELVFSITLDDRETYNYEDVDLSEEIMAEAKSIVESFKRIDKVEESTLGPNVTDTGFNAHLELSERLLIGEEINLKFTLMNESDTPLYFLKWYTPLEGIGGEIFKVTRDGQVVPYKGILASRTPPTADAYVLINPGESVSTVVDISGAFDLSEVGEYRIKFISPRISHIAQTEDEMAKTMEELGPVSITSNEVSLELVGSP